MTKKKAEQPRIADPTKHRSREVPDYKRPFGEFQRTVKIGNRVKLFIRAFNQEKNEYYLYESNGAVIDIYIKGFRWREEKTAHVRSKPWWGVHDWEILEKGNDND